MIVNALLPFMRSRGVFWLALLTAFSSNIAIASSQKKSSWFERVGFAPIVCWGSVRHVSCERDVDTGLIRTRATIQVLEALKGRLPDEVQLVYRGGVVAGRGEIDGHAPRLRVGEERLFLLSPHRDGSFSCLNGRADTVLLQAAPGVPYQGKLKTERWLRNVRRGALSPSNSLPDVNGQFESESSMSFLASSDSIAESHGELTGLLVDDEGISARFIGADRGDPIPYKVDTELLPSGVTVDQALQAVATALQAWTETTGMLFSFEGQENFGKAAPNVAAHDGVLRIQLHDKYGYILGPTTLGIGGQAFLSTIIEPAGWATGGNVGGHEFHRVSQAYVVLKHTDAALQDLTTFTEALGHEIGHALSLDHSSEDPDETNPELAEAIMYHTIHADGRGAQLNDWDTTTIAQVYPRANTPPFSFDRILDITTDFPDQPNFSGINEILLRGYDRQSSADLALTLTNVSLNAGSWTLIGSLLRYTADGFIGGERLPPSGNSFYDRLHARFSDGTNASPPVVVRVLSFNPDTRPSPDGDGIPDDWMLRFFGDIDPASGPDREAEDDADGDGLTNRQEFQLGTDPTDSGSKLHFTTVTHEQAQFLTMPFHLYEIQASSDLQSWVTEISVLPTNTMVTMPIVASPGQPGRYYRIFKVP